MFELGQTAITRNALDWCQQNDVDPIELLQRHHILDQGSLCDEDAQLNHKALNPPHGRIFSAFVYNGEKLYVITEWDRSVTTIMLTSDY
jgi:hypothetical protein